MNRRRWLKHVVQWAVCGAAPASSYSIVCATENTDAAAVSGFDTRSIVLLPSDLVEVDWPRIAHDAGLTTIAVHGGPASVAEFIQGEDGTRFLERATALGLHVEYELHAIRDLLPRTLFDKHPEMFRMNQNGDRVADANCCPASREGLAIICENAVKYAQALRPTTHRYFYWPDDVAPTCNCPKCRGFSDSEQAVIVENAILAALKKSDPQANLSHLAYVGTLSAPQRVPPAPGLFLEFAPIERSWAHPLAETDVIGRTGRGRRPTTHGQTLDLLDGNLEVFPRETAQILEYWLDASLHSNWKRPAVQVPWNAEVLQSDLRTYAKRGIRHFTSFAAWIDGDYVNRFGAPDFVEEYGAALNAQSID